MHQVLPDYWPKGRSSKFKSFVRQLHTFGFKTAQKERSDSRAFSNPCFIRGRPDLLPRTFYIAKLF
jgi:hypothetical protein